MSVMDKFEMPDRLMIEEDDQIENYAKFIAEPLEKGFGNTLGNALRRVLLSSLEGIAVTWIRIEGATHEFSTIPNVIEDVTDIVLNFKNIHFDCSGDLPRKLELRVHKAGEVKAGDIQVDSVTQIINPEQIICTIDKPTDLYIEMEINKGRGFRLAEDNKKEDQPIGVIPIDSLFSPITRVSYSVHECRKGQRTDYDRLEVELWTDGRITPQESINKAASILIDHLDVFVGSMSDKQEDTKSLITNEHEEVLLRKLLMNVDQLHLSVRAQNCLDNANIRTLGELVQRSEAEMLKYRNFGQKSLNELKEKVVEMGLELNIELPETVRIALQKELEKKNKINDDK